MADGAWTCGPLVGFDIETTGLDCERDEPVSFAFVEFRGATRTAVEAGFVLPARAISRGAAAVHRLTRDRLVALGAMDVAAAARRIAERLAELSSIGVPVVGCNLSYDLTIVDRVLSRLEAPVSLRAAGWEGPLLDVLVLDRGLDPDFTARPVRRLDALCEHYGVGPPRHTAESDAEAAVRVLLAQAGRFPGFAVRSLGELQAAQAAWHVQWSDAFAERRAHGQGTLFSNSEPWPYAERAVTR
ncbi:MAG TPA: exonuclease domain-containing protein [Acidimicrobiales bacterium]|nr:exonuclease domain-containing protein [Acidimicrobiales bacterium]